ncbi:hypothetical protein [Bradyrhizobium sp. AT1]|uniref:hypothetical protein n=1 Tax=Bradyrhizobium sp. AT1 TaxID=574934 RepID=UPI0012ED7A73|nr:hypothetical protein [Bradyrhizobium sp. AT1]
MTGLKIEWQPIATAPRDLTMVRLRLEKGVGNNREPIETTGQHVSGAWAEVPNRGLMHPTHWAPL